MFADSAGHILFNAANAFSSSGRMYCFLLARKSSALFSQTLFSFKIFLMVSDGILSSSLWAVLWNSHHKKASQSVNDRGLGRPIGSTKRDARIERSNVCFLWSEKVLISVIHKAQTPAGKATGYVWRFTETLFVYWMVDFSFIMWLRRNFRQNVLGIL